MNLFVIDHNIVNSRIFPHEKDPEQIYCPEPFKWDDVVSDYFHIKMFQIVA